MRVLLKNILMINPSHINYLLYATVTIANQIVCGSGLRTKVGLIGLQTQYDGGSDDC